MPANDSTRQADLAWGAAIAGLLGYELYALSRGKTLLSQAVWKASARHPLLSFAAGILAGHFFWQADGLYDREAAS